MCKFIRPDEKKIESIGLTGTIIDFCLFFHSGPASKLVIKFCIAVLCGFLGVLFTFPGIRVSRMFFDSLK